MFLNVVLRDSDCDDNNLIIFLTIIFEMTFK